MTGTELRTRRKALGLSQGGLAKRLGVSSNTVARWERGELRIGRPEMVGMSLDQIKREVRIMERQPVGLDITEDANVPKAVCADCADAYDGEPIYRGDEWGGTECRCVRCGASIPVTLVY